MKDCVNNEVHIGDRVIMTPRNKCDFNKIYFGIIIKISQNNACCWCKIINSGQYEIEVKKYPEQIYKLEQNYK